MLQRFTPAGSADRFTQRWWQEGNGATLLKIHGKKVLHQNKDKMEAWIALELRAKYNLEPLLNPPISRARGQVSS